MEKKLTKTALGLSILLLISVWSMVLSGCQEDHDFRIGVGCTDPEIELIKIGLEKANVKFRLDMKIAGRRDDGYEHQDTTDSIYCIHDKEYKRVEEEGIVIGEMRTDDILVFSHLINSRERWLSTFMHELGHYMGLIDVDDNTDIMNWKVTNPIVTEY